MKLAAVTYRYFNGGGCVELDDDANAAVIVERQSRTSPAALKRLAAKKLRAMADRLDREASGTRANRSKQF